MHTRFASAVVAGMFLLAASAATVAQTGPDAGSRPGAAEASDAAGAAKAILARAVQAVQRDKKAALQAFTAGANGFSQGELYVFCFGPDGKIDAHPNAALIGADAGSLTDINGKHFATEMLQVAQPDTFTEVNYAWPKLLTNQPMPKTSYVMKVDDQVCGVGYYR